MYKSFFKAVGLLMMVFLMTTSCDEDIPLKLTSAQRDQLDTLFSSQVKDLGIEMDSLCDLLFEQDLDLVVDSIMKVRKAQEEELRKRYQ
jgi:hypothetical protein